MVRSVWKYVFPLRLNDHLSCFSSLVIFRFAFPRAQGAQWNIVLLTFIPICSGLIPYLYVLEASSHYHLSNRVSSTVR